MIKPDATLLIQIQLAIIGIVVVAGLFYLWRVIVRLEQRINKISCKCPPPSMQMPSPFMMGGLGHNQVPNFAEENSKDELAAAQELMQQVFGGMDQPGMMMFSMPQPHQPQFMNEDQSSCVVEEIVESPLEGLIEDKEEESKNNSVEGQVVKQEDDDNESVSTDTNPFSKSKLSQMKVEKLRALCSERELSAEGQKPQLIDRLLGVTRE